MVQDDASNLSSNIPVDCLNDTTYSEGVCACVYASFIYCIVLNKSQSQTEAWSCPCYLTHYNKQR